MKAESVPERRLRDTAVDFLRIFRAHTAPATTLIVVPFYLLGGGNLATPFGAAVFLWSILVHWAGYGENSVMDFYGGFDELDENKRHFPLVAGRVSLSAAQKVIHTFLIGVSAYAALLILFSGGWRGMALACILMAVACGHAYNDGLGKFTSLKFIPLTGFGAFLAAGCYYMAASPYSLVESLLTLVPSFLGLATWRATRDLLFVLSFGYAVMGAFYQIGWLGELKEIRHPSEVNLLRKLGCRCDGVEFNAGWARLFGDVTKAGQLAFAAAIAYVVNHPAAWVSLAVLGAGALYFHQQTAKRRNWVRNNTLEDSAKEEICVLFLYPLLVSPVIGFHVVAFLIPFSLAWFVAFNRLLWGTVIRPQV